MADFERLVAEAKRRHIYPLLPVSFGSASLPHRQLVSSPRHIARSGRISRTTRSCTFHLKGYGTYQTGTTAEIDRTYATRYAEKSLSVS